MKTEHTLRLYTKPVSYHWLTPSGLVQSGRTVVVSRTRHGLQQALKRFWTLNPQVHPAH